MDADLVLAPGLELELHERVPVADAKHAVVRDSGSRLGRASLRAAVALIGNLDDVPARFLAEQ